jgi:large subunit ribosomal protein L5
MNKMKEIKVAKVTLNIGAGKDQGLIKKGIKLLGSITNSKPIETITNKRIAGWGIRPGLPIGCKVTLRKKKAIELLNNLLKAKENKLNEKQFDDNGNIAFGIPEYIDIPGVKYDPDIGILGLEVCVTLERAGYRIKRRKICKKKVHKNHKITKEEAIEYMKNNFGVVTGG